MRYSNNSCVGSTLYVVCHSNMLLLFGGVRRGKAHSVIGSYKWFDDEFLMCSVPAVLRRVVFKLDTIIFIIIINCNWVVTRWQWLFYMYTEHEIGY